MHAKSQFLPLQFKLVNASDSYLFILAMDRWPEMDYMFTLSHVHNSHVLLQALEHLVKTATAAVVILPVSGSTETAYFLKVVKSRLSWQFHDIH